MKKLFLILTAALALVAVSCNDNNKPDDPKKDDGKKELTALDSKASTWNVDQRFFDLAFSGEGIALKTQLIGFDAELGAGKYKLVALASAKAGDAVLEKTLYNDAAVASGDIAVAKNGKKYTFTANLTPAAGEAVTLTWSGDIDWPADPAPKKELSVLMNAQVNQSGENAFTLTLNLATPGISQEYQQQGDGSWAQVWTGEGGYLALDIFSTDKYLHEGIYHANAVGGVLAEGEFGIGYDTDVEYWGQIYHVENWGSCWWAVKDGAATATKILDGIVVVRYLGEGSWQISWGKEYPTEYVFEVAIENLTQPETTDPDVVLELTSGLTYTMEDKTAENFADQANTPLSGVTLWRVTVSDANDWVAAFDLVVAEGETDIAGEYTIMGYPHEAGTAGNGVYMDMDEYDYHIHCGCYFRVGEKIYLLNNDSKVIVTANSNGTLKFEFGGAEVADAATWQSAGFGALLLDNVAKAE